MFIVIYKYVDCFFHWILFYEQNDVDLLVLRLGLE